MKHPSEIFEDYILGKVNYIAIRADDLITAMLLDGGVVENKQETEPIPYDREDGTIWLEIRSGIRASVIEHIDKIKHIIKRDYLKCEVTSNLIPDIIAIAIANHMVPIIKNKKTSCNVSKRQLELLLKFPDTEIRLSDISADSGDRRALGLLRRRGYISCIDGGTGSKAYRYKLTKLGKKILVDLERRGL